MVCHSYCMSAIPVEHHYQRWENDGVDLALIGASLYQQDTKVRVRLPRELADAALMAWQREDEDSEDLHSHEESAREAQIRRRAGTLALIGASLENAPIQISGDYIIAELDSWYVGEALQAADDARLI